MTSTAAPLAPTTTTSGKSTAPITAARHAMRAPSIADKRVRLLGSLVIAAGLILGLSGAGTWAFVQSSLAGENIGFALRAVGSARTV